MQGGSFYATKEQITAQTMETLAKMKAVDPEFLAKALIYARSEGNLQEAPITGLAVLSTAADKGPFQKAFNRIVQTPDNLIRFVAKVKDGTIRQGLGGVALKAAKGWFAGLSEYHALKYSGNSPSVMEGERVVENNYSLRDTVLLARPSLSDPAVN
jgi:60 kDa SS-A/Ro ribonucleoprotein